MSLFRSFRRPGPGSTLIFLLAAASTLAGVEVRIIAPVTRVRPGGTVDLVAHVTGAQNPACRWEVVSGGGSVDARGRFTASFEIKGEEVCVLRAVSEEDPAKSDEVNVRVVPGAEATDLADLLTDLGGSVALRDAMRGTGYLGDGQGLELKGRPFLDVEKGTRFGGGKVASSAHAAALKATGGAGLSTAVAWDKAARDADGILLSYLAGEDWNLVDVTGKTSVDLCLDRAVRTAQLEVLRKDAKGAYASVTSPVEIRVRGLLPWAGDPDFAPGHRDGLGSLARFQAPCGLVVKEGREGITAYVADAEAHVIRQVAGDGRVTTLCGLPGEAGLLDGKGAEARFNGPTFLALEPGSQGRLVVADTGNHAIRVVDAQGTVLTWGGGQQGHRDSTHALEARFDRPMGVAVDPGLNIYVADAGNHCIRRIAPDGSVTTLAGSGARGFQDGVGGAATFSDLKGLVWHKGRLLVADGNCIRELVVDAEAVASHTALPDLDPEALEVRTLLGTPGEEGASVHQPLDKLLNDGASVRLKDPYALAMNGDVLLIADRGNHTVHEVSAHGLHGPGTFKTILGHPGGGEVRWGLLRDSYPGIPSARHARIQAPAGIAASRGRILVSTGSGVVLADALPAPVQGETQVRIGSRNDFADSEPPAGEGLEVPLAFEFLPADDSLGRSFPLTPVAWFADLMREDADGSLTSVFHHEEEAPASAAAVLRLDPQQRGRHALHVGWITADGSTCWDRVWVEFR